MTHLILEVSDVDEWPKRYIGPTIRIPENRRPTMLQPSEDIAVEEARRLAREHPGKRFAVFRPFIIAACERVPTHVTLGGQVVKDAATVRLMDIAEAPPESDDIPF